jgi:hypothetical protein
MSDEDGLKQKLGLSIREFCDLHGISEGFYFELKKQGLGPREMHLGARRIISIEEAAKWRAARTKAPENAA